MASEKVMLRIGGREIDLSGRVLVMGILNRTPDSFSDRGRYFDLETALARADELVAMGADIVDVGGQKAGPGDPVSVEEEIERVCPVIEHLASRGDVFVSVDTFVAEVAEAAAKAGAQMVNDISGLADPEMVNVIDRHGLTAVVTHIQGRPRVPNPNPRYRDLLREVEAFLLERVERLRSIGIPRERIVIDAGFDLGKSSTQSLSLLRHTARFARLGYPLLVSPSNKRFIGDATGLPVHDRLFPTIAAVCYGVAFGARIVRVHHVEETVKAVRLLEAVMNSEADVSMSPREGD